MTADVLNEVYTESSWYQPASLSHAPFLSFQDKAVIQEEPGACYTAIQNQGQLWDIVCIPYTALEFFTDNFQPLLVNEEGKAHGDIIFADLSSQQKDAIMCTLQDDALLTAAYTNIEKLKELIIHRENLPSLQTDIPKLVVTNPVLLPYNIQERGANRTQGMLDYLSRDISAFFEPEFLDETSYRHLFKFSQATGNTTIHPAQFMAQHFNAHTDVTTGKIFYSEPAAEEAVNLSNLKPMDFWNIYYLKPYGAQVITITTSLKETCLFLKQMEQEFITPHYQHDRVARELMEQVSDISDFSPLHYSKITTHQFLNTDHPLKPY